MMMNSVTNTIPNTFLGLTNSNTVLNDLKRLAYVFLITTYEVASSS